MDYSRKWLVISEVQQAVGGNGMCPNQDVLWTLKIASQTLTHIPESHTMAATSEGPAVLAPVQTLAGGQGLLWLLWSF